MKKFTSIFAIFAISILLVILSVSVSADSRDSRITAVSTPSLLTPYGKGQLYDMAEEYFDACEYDMANALYSKLQDNPEVIKRLDEIEQVKKQQIYDAAEEAFDSGEYELAIKLFGRILYFSDSNIRIAECEDALSKKQIEVAEEAFDSGDYDLAFSYIRDNDTFEANVLKKQIVNAKNEDIYQEANKAYDDEEYEIAVILYSSIPDYKDSNIRATLSRKNAYELRAAEDKEEEYEMETFR